MLARLSILPRNDHLDEYIKQISGVPRDVILEQAPTTIAECHNLGYRHVLCYLEKFSIHFNSRQYYECIHSQCYDYYSALVMKETLNRDSTGREYIVVDRNNQITTDTNRILSYLSMMTDIDAHICERFLRALCYLNRPSYDKQILGGTDFKNSIDGVLVDPVSVAFFTHRGLIASADLFLSMLFASGISGNIENIIVNTILKHNKQLVWNVLAAYITRTTTKGLYWGRGDRCRSYYYKHRSQYDESTDVGQRQITWRNEVIRICSNAINALTYDDIVEFEHNDKLVTMFVRAFGTRVYHSMSFAGVIIEQLLRRGLSLDINGNQPHSLRTVLILQGYHHNKNIHNAIEAFGYSTTIPL